MLRLPQKLAMLKKRILKRKKKMLRLPQKLAMLKIN
jgi:hypothetical protein